MLPDKPSQLIRLALKDMQLCMQNNKYVIDMTHWHRPIRMTNTCHVCLAGSVMAQSLGAYPGEDAQPRQYTGTEEGDKVWRKLIFLNEIRVNRLVNSSIWWKDNLEDRATAMIPLQVLLDDALTDMDPSDPASLLEHLPKFADKLESIGL